MHRIPYLVSVSYTSSTSSIHIATTYVPIIHDDPAAEPAASH
jgi:hypothetical protein